MAEKLRVLFVGGKHWFLYLGTHVPVEIFLVNGFCDSQQSKTCTGRSRPAWRQRVPRGCFPVCLLARLSDFWISWADVETLLLAREIDIINPSKLNGRYMHHPL
jgi:hypothetical protein